MITSPLTLTTQLARDLQELVTGSERCAGARKNIAEAAHGMRGNVESELSDLRGRALTDDDAAQAYQDKILERGTLDRVSASA